MMQGFEDCNDHAKLQNDSVIEQAVGKQLCSQPTLSRFEKSLSKHDILRLCHWFVDRYISNLPSGKKEITIDIDSTDAPIHGAQQLSLFNGYYYQWMYNELIINDGNSGEIILPALRPGNSHSGKWVIAILKRIIKKIQARFPGIKSNYGQTVGFRPRVFTILSGNLGLVSVLVIQPMMY